MTPHAIDAAHIERQRQWSRETFGPGPRTAGVLDHIRKELAEVEQDPTDVSEWADVVILALDGAWRAGHEPQQIVDAIVAKQERNEAREWPDWRTAEDGKAIEHVRPEDDRVEATCDPVDGLRHAIDPTRCPGDCRRCDGCARCLAPAT